MEVRATLEDLMYLSILEKFVVLQVEMLPRLDGEGNTAQHSTAWHTAALTGPHSTVPLSLEAQLLVSQLQLGCATPTGCGETSQTAAGQSGSALHTVTHRLLDFAKYATYHHMLSTCREHHTWDVPHGDSYQLALQTDRKIW